ncbi:MAG: FAD-dependent oxidoreductase [Gammaproteobacteria bacterium]|nr:FAD-dependent oxidoreductase [Gammaproteobacteria bacterium]
MRTEFDLCVIGGGAAGLVIAAGGAKLGAKVALVEKRELGGDCLRYGCVPSKALLHAAKIAQTMREASRAGLTSHEPAVSLADVMQHVQSVIYRLEPNDSPERFRGLGVNVIFGAGQFLDRETFKVNGRTITARRFVLATGSRPIIPSVEGLETTPYLTNETIFDLHQPVPHLLVLGAGPIGIELAQAFRRLGSEVSVIGTAPQILPREDADMASVVQERLAAEGIDLHLSCTVRHISNVADKISISIKTRDERILQIHGSHLLVATGRAPNVEDLGLEAAGVALENGRPKIDARLRTTNRRIYACGDLAGPYLFTHMAEYQAGVVLRNALFHMPAKAQTRVVPWCTFTDPELARVGLSEAEAVRAGISHSVYRFPFADVDRAVADGEPTGCAKIVTDRRGRLLGAAIAGAHAGELIHEYALALSKNMKVSDLAGVIHIYPTLAQINRRVAEQRLKEGLTPARRRWLQRLFGLRGTERLAALEESPEAVGR